MSNEWSAGSLWIGEKQPEYILTICKDGREVVRIKQDGNVIIAEGVSLEEASIAFWQAVEELGKRRTPWR